MRFLTLNNIIRTLVGTIIIALVCLVLLHPSFANAGATIAASLLLYMTLEYVLLNNANVQLFREQLDQQRKIYLDFGAEIEAWKPTLWIANLGTATFIVKSVDVRARGELLKLPTHILVPSGTIEKFLFPEEVYQSTGAFLDLDVSLECVGLERAHRTAAKAYHFLLGDGQVSQICEGILLGNFVKCPRCGEWVGMLRADGLRNFDDARDREKIVEDELQQSCPEHRSRWLEASVSREST